jgi:alpha-L-fucosidase 2
MLLQSHRGYIELLPALPPEWPNGEIKGLCARGGFVVDMKWENRMLVSARIYAKQGGTCHVKYQGIIKKFTCLKQKSCQINVNPELQN